MATIPRLSAFLRHNAKWRPYTTPPRALLLNYKMVLLQKMCTNVLKITSTLGTLLSFLPQRQYILLWHLLWTFLLDWKQKQDILKICYTFKTERVEKQNNTLSKILTFLCFPTIPFRFSLEVKYSRTLCGHNGYILKLLLQQKNIALTGRYWQSESPSDKSGVFFGYLKIMIPWLLM